VRKVCKKECWRVRCATSVRVDAHLGGVAPQRCTEKIARRVREAAATRHEFLLLMSPAQCAAAKLPPARPADYRYRAAAAYTLPCKERTGTLTVRVLSLRQQKNEFMRCRAARGGAQECVCGVGAEVQRSGAAAM